MEMKLKRLLPLFLVVVMMALVLTACEDRTQTPGNNNNPGNGANDKDEDKDNDGVDDKDEGKDGDKDGGVTSKHYAPTYQSYESFDTMYDDADVIIRGTVERASPETTDEYIYLTYDIKASEVYSGDLDKDDVVTIRQTKTTPASQAKDRIGEKSPLLSEGNDYFLFLKKVPAGDGYEDHYIILGEDQGYAEVFDGTRIRTSSSLFTDGFDSPNDLIERINGKLSNVTS